MPRDKKSRRDDPERRKHRELMEIRRAALKVAEWEHSDDEGIKAARKALQDARDAFSASQQQSRLKRSAVQLAEENLNKALEKFLPEALRPPEG